MGEQQEDEEKQWEDVLRRMLPSGDPLPDEDHLDYSIAVEYEGPSLPYSIPTVDPVDVDSLSARSSSPVANSPPSVAAATVDTAFARPPPRFACIRTSANGSGHSSFASRSDVRNGGGAVDSAASPSGSPTDQDPYQDFPSSQRGTAAVDGRRAVVTFVTGGEDDDDNDDGEEEGMSSWRSFGQDRSPSEVFVRKEVNRHICRRCGKGNRLREKEACLVCDGVDAGGAQVHELHREAD